MWKGTLKQLVKEFWFPGLIATAWTIYTVWGEISVETLIAAFTPAFFLASWSTSQFFRVRKQAGVESSLKALEGRLTGLVEKIENETGELLNHMTGGESFCYMLVMADNLNWVVIHQGTHHLQNLSARVCDIDALASPDSWRTANANVDIGILFKGMCVQSLAIPLNADHRRFNIFFVANNGSFLQELRLKRTGDNHWATATRVIRSSDGEQIVLFERIDPDFPLEADGTPGY